MPHKSTRKPIGTVVITYTGDHQKFNTFLKAIVQNYLAVSASASSEPSNFVAMVEDESPPEYPIAM